MKGSTFCASTGIAAAASAIERITRENNMVEKNLAAAFLTR